MRISARCDYACRAVLELAMQWPSKEPLRIGEISNRQNMPVGFLVHILIQLKRLGIVDSVRGKGGGYILAKTPDKITLGMVVRGISGPIVSYEKKDNLFANIWDRVEKEAVKIVDNITYEELCDKAKGGVYYI